VVQTACITGVIIILQNTGSNSILSTDYMFTVSLLFLQIIGADTELKVKLIRQDQPKHNHEIFYVWEETTGWLSAAAEVKPVTGAYEVRSFI